LNQLGQEIFRGAFQFLRESLAFAAQKIQNLLVRGASTSAICFAMKAKKSKPAIVLRFSTKCTCS